MLDKIRYAIIAPNERADSHKAYFLAGAQVPASRDGHRMTQTELTAGRLRELLDYDSASGMFTRAGAGSSPVRCYKTPKGYLRILADGKQYPAHRLAWLHVHGRWPGGIIDHINGERSDNRIENLRQGDAKLNAENRRTARPDNESGFMGVRRHWRGKKWQARIDMGGGKQKSLGLYDDPESAHAAYVVAKRRLHAGCTL